MEYDIIIYRDNTYKSCVRFSNKKRDDVLLIIKNTDLYNLPHSHGTGYTPLLYLVVYFINNERYNLNNYKLNEIILIINDSILILNT